MEFVQAGLPLSFEVTFEDPSLDVAMEVWDDSGASPVFVSRTPMLNFTGYTYRAKFTPTAGKTYLVNKSVYTDNTYATKDNNFPQGSESFRAEDIAGLVLNAVLASYQTLGSVGSAIARAANKGNSAVVSIQGKISTVSLVGNIGG